MIVLFYYIRRSFTESFDYPLLSDYSRKKKIDYFISAIPEGSRILEIGCAGGWVRESLSKDFSENYVGLDVVEPADIVGDILNWRELGIEENSFDVIIAFEVVEHVNCFQELYDILRPGGLLMLTSPVPSMDWLCKLLEIVGLNQKRTSKHDCLVNFKTIPLFEAIELKYPAGMAQWGIFKKPIDENCEG